ncbi:hypothetical protein ES703_54110 [subsurface metagenome]
MYEGWFRPDVMGILNAMELYGYDEDELRDEVWDLQCEALDGSRGGPA